MRPFRKFAAIAICASLAFATACSKHDASGPRADAGNADSAISKEADAFVARVNATFRDHDAELQSAQWLAATDINSDSQRLAANANARAAPSETSSG